MPENPNPQGKGLVPVLEALDKVLPRHLLTPKKLEQVEMELFTSLFVLQSRFSFQPIPETPYWMYQVEDKYQLSMIAPDEGGENLFGRLIGECVLHTDRTWTLVLDPIVEQDADFVSLIEKHQQNCRQMLEEAEKLQDAMPVYTPGLGFYGKVLAYTLGRSLDISMQLSGIASLSYEGALAMLEKKD